MWRGGEKKREGGGRVERVNEEGKRGCWCEIRGWVGWNERLLC